MSDDEYRRLDHDLHDYSCGLRAGERLKLKMSLPVEDHRNQPTGEVHEPGEIWIVILGSADEPDVVWLRQPDGNTHTWDADDIFESFERSTES